MADPYNNYGETPDDIELRRQFANLLLKQGADTSPAAGGWGEALARAVTGIAGGLSHRWATQSERADKAAAAKNFSDSLATYFAAPKTSSPPVAPASATTPFNKSMLRTDYSGPQPNTATPEMINAIQTQESQGNPAAVSPAGAQGPMQIMPKTAGNPGLGVTPAAYKSGSYDANNPSDVAENKRVGADYFNSLLKRYNGDVDAALVGYNAGPARADAWMRSGKKMALPAETQGYIQKVKDNLNPPQQTAPTQGQRLQGLIKLLDNPWATDSEKALVKSLIDRETEQGKTTFTQIGEDQYTGQKKFGFVTEPTSSEPEGKVQPWNEQAGTTGSGVQDAAYDPASGISGPTGDDYLKTLPQSEAALVKGLAEGRWPFPTGYALRSPRMQSLLKEVSQYDKDFDAVNYNARYQVRKDFTSGPSSKSMNAINTAIGHLTQFMGPIAKLANTNYPDYNAFMNWWADRTGNVKRQAAVADFEAVKKAVSAEITRAWRGAQGAESDIQEWQKVINSANSPTALYSVLGTIGHLLESKLSALNDTYEKGMKTDKYPLQMLSPDSRKSLDAIDKLVDDPESGALPPDNTPQPSPGPTKASSPILHPSITVNGRPATIDDLTAEARRRGIQ